jgi:hypothetical protein
MTNEEMQAINDAFRAAHLRAMNVKDTWDSITAMTHINAFMLDLQKIMQGKYNEGKTKNEQG